MWNREGGSHGPPIDHVKHIEAGHRPVAEPVTPAHGTKQRSLLIPGDSGRRDPGVQILFEGTMPGHLMALAAFFMQAEPRPLAMLEVVADLHRDRSADPGEAVDHRSDPRHSVSDRELKLDWDFVDVGPFRQVHGPVLEHNASGFVHDEAKACFRGSASF